MDFLVLESEDSRIELPPTCLLVALDETGHEQFADPNYPVFGIGGCAVLVQDYSRLVRDPCLYMKEKFFGDANLPLHASELGSPTQTQLDALNHFFTNFEFFRIAILISDKAELSTSIKPYPIVARSLWARIADIAKWTPLTELALVFEASDRGDSLNERHFSGYKLTVKKNGGDLVIPHEGFIMPKRSQEPILEVADFIIQASGGQTRARQRGAQSPSRKDFQAIFRKVDKRLTSFLEITRAI